MNITLSILIIDFEYLCFTQHDSKTIPLYFIGQWKTVTDKMIKLIE